jgi:uncharacterized protein YjiS (DUF1127 family)
MMLNLKRKPWLLLPGTSLLQTISGAVANARLCAKTRRALYALDDRALSDIGISRCEIDRISRDSVL